MPEKPAPEVENQLMKRDIYMNKEEFSIEYTEATIFRVEEFLKEKGCHKKQIKKIIGELKEAGMI